MININIRHTAIAILAMIAYSCSTNTVYHKYQSISPDGWRKDDTLKFIIPDSLESGTYRAEIGLRHTDSYPYKDLWLSVISPVTGKADSIHIYLANDRGNWNSNGSTGGFFQLSVPYSSFSHNSMKDSIIRVYHIMKDNPLPEITDIGLKITKE